MSLVEIESNRVRPKVLRAAAVGAILSIGLDVVVTSHDAAFADSAYAVTIPRGSNVPMELHAPANASCELAAMNSPSSQRLMTISDANGVARYFVRLDRAARNGVLATLECKSSRAHTLTGFKLSPGTAAPQRPPIAPGPPVTLTGLATTARFGVLPGTPAGFDVTAASDAQLAQLHYPKRPNARSGSMAYSMWRKAVTTPGMYVPTVPIPIPAGPNRMISRALLSEARTSGARAKPEGITSFADPTSWLCGSFVFELNSPMSEIDGYWSIPQLTGFVIGLSTSSTAVAFNGMSEGTEQDVLYFPSFGSFSSYYPWYQSGSDRYGFNFPIAPGDTVGVEMGLEGGGTAGFGLYDSTNNQSADVVLPNPYGYGYSAAWVEERPDAQLPLAPFTPVTINGAVAYAVNPYPEYEADGSVWSYIWRQPLPYDSYQTSFYMTSTGSWTGDRMCNPSISPATSSSDASVGSQFVSPF